MQIAKEPQARMAHGSRLDADASDALQGAFWRMKAAYRNDPLPSHETRIARLDRLLQIVRDYRREIAEAICDDFGNRSQHETYIAEILTLVTSVRSIKKNLKQWMAPESRHVMFAMRPGSAKVHHQPLGVVGVIAPWNYPFQLAIGPVAAALAAGNRVMLKPSEYTPRTSLLLRRVIRDAFEPEVLTVVTGGAEVAASFARLPFDHLLFTGSTQVGRAVMRAAAENLTPVTLELGGKSPALVHESYPLAHAAARIASGKCFNAGQTCIAPDYALIPSDKLDVFAGHVRASVARAYPTLADNPDYTSLVNDKQYERVAGLVADAVARGARKVEINPAGERFDPKQRKLPPTLLLGVTDEMKVMQEEIFGPVLPVVGYDSIEDALDYINDRPHPLAFYYFDVDKQRVARVLDQTVSGGATVNDTLIHFGVDDLPFGGVGPSGIGAYHGRAGFETFSHRRGVFYQSRVNAAAFMAPPYGKRAEQLMELMLGRSGKGK